MNQSFFKSISKLLNYNLEDEMILQNSIYNIFTEALLEDIDKFSHYILAYNKFIIYNNAIDIF